MAWDGDIGDEPPGALRDAPPDLRSPIDPRAPVGGHHPTEATGPAIHELPEHDWSVASKQVVPVLRAPGGAGTRLAELGEDRLAQEGLRTHALPLLDDGPAAISIAYAIRAGGFDVLVNADHLLEWGISPTDLRAAAFANLEAWSNGAGWTDDRDGGRRVLSSDTGEGGDAARILLPEVRAHLQAQLGEGCRVLVGLPDRHLLMAVPCRVEDAEFVELFASFVAGQAAGADEAVESRLFELVDGELVPFEA